MRLIFILLCFVHYTTCNTMWLVYGVKTSACVESYGSQVLEKAMYHARPKDQFIICTYHLSYKKYNDYMKGEERDRNFPWNWPKKIDMLSLSNFWYLVIHIPRTHGELTKIVINMQLTTQTFIVIKMYFLLFPWI